MKTANNQRPTPNSMPPALDAAGVPVPEPTENESTRSSYDILLAVLAELSCRIQTDEPSEEVDKNGHILSFTYQGAKFIVRVSKETQFVLLRFLIKTEVNDLLSLLALANDINDIEVLYKAFVVRDEDQSYYIELDYCCMSVASQDIITAMEDMLHICMKVQSTIIYMKVQSTIKKIESTDNQETTADEAK